MDRWATFVLKDVTKIFSHHEEIPSGGNNQRGLVDQNPNSWNCMVKHHGLVGHKEDKTIGLTGQGRKTKQLTEGKETLPVT